MRKSYRDDNGEKVFRYSIRKYHFGAASVAVAALMFFANGAVAASETITPTTASDIVKADSDSNADGDPGTSDEEDSSKVSTRQPLELKSVDELKGQEAPVEENNQVQAAAESETTGVESNSAQPETNPASQEAPQAEGEGKQDQSTPVSNQISSTSLLQPRTLKNKQSDYDPIPLGDDEDDVRDGLFSSENPVTTIQPRSSRSVQPKENSSGVHSVRAEAKQSRFGQVKGKPLIHGDNPANYIKFKNANGQEVQKPAGVDVAWAEKPSTTQEGLNK
ncbi:YSIRK-type signal peptide-containing protein, partial [Streptococcus pneumoniae]|uniref:YSIRK-type signal peptide-containing protein n=1 Tax=Streptococcus pneumoniae TaxID=1313 RepID=UPI00099B44D9